MYAHITPRIIPPHIHIQERGWDSIVVMDSDWQDKGPDACRARREIYNACNGRIVAFDGEAFLVEDTTNFMLLGGQGHCVVSVCGWGPIVVARAYCGSKCVREGGYCSVEF